MNKIRTLACIALLASLAACRDEAPAAPANQPAEPGGLAGIVGAAMDKARAEMETRNISISNGVQINFNGHEIGTPSGNLPHAEITPQGDLLVAGKPVDLTPAQRTLLLDYRHEIIGLTAVDRQGETLGKITEIFETGSNDVYVVTGERGELLLPATEEVVLGVDLEAGVIAVDVLEGLEWEAPPEERKRRVRSRRPRGRTGGGAR